MHAVEYVTDKRLCRSRSVEQMTYGDTSVAPMWDIARWSKFTGGSV